MIVAPLRAAAAQGARATWLDLLIEFGIPISAFVVLSFQSSREEKAKREPEEATRPK